MNCQQCGAILPAATRFCPACGAPAARVSLPLDISERAAGFLPRAWALDHVADWLDHGAERFFFLTGEPGSGKTALAVWLAGAGPSPEEGDLRDKLAGVRHAWRAAHFCVARGQSGTLHPVRFAQSLARQLSEHYDDYAVAVLQRLAPAVNIHAEARQNWGRVIGAQIETLIVNSNAQDMYNHAVREPLEVLYRREPHLRICILVDALDEALTFGDPNIVTLLAGSNDLPPGVRFLLTSRNELRVLDQFDQKRHLNFSDPQHVRHVNTDLWAYVERRLAQEKIKAHLTSAGAPQGVEKRIVAQAAGNFLYARFLLDEIADGKRSPAHLAGLPRGLYGLYREFLDRLLPEMLVRGTSQVWLEKYQPILGSLSVATPAAPRAVLPNWVQRPESEVSAVLSNDLYQIIEHDPGEEGDRLYHHSMAEFLAAATYQDNGASRPNRYFTPPYEQHDRIARYYLDNFKDDWQACDAYGLRHLVGHLNARLRLAPRPSQKQHADALYGVVLDEQFRQAQLHTLSDIHPTLADLWTVLGSALDRHDLVKALACVGLYCDTIRSQSLVTAVFQAIDEGNFDRALELASQVCYEVLPKPRSDWEQVLQVYLAWEAAEQHDVAAVRKVMTSASQRPPTWGNDLRDALLTRLVRTLAGTEGDPRAWLVELAPGQNPEALLTRYDLSPMVDPARRQESRQKLSGQLAEFRRLVDEGNPEAISVVPLLHEEEVGAHAADLRDLLVELAAAEEGQTAIDEMLRLVLPNPYPRYRDIGLVALGIACLAVPTASWVRSRLRSILETGLNQEGVTFTFDLPAVLLEEAGKRQLPAPELSAYLATALQNDNRWGTAMRAQSARATALFWQGNPAAACDALEEARHLSSGFAGYGTLTLLSLANRWYEFGVPERLMPLLDEAEAVAQNVRDGQFRQERLQLAHDYRHWTRANPPDLDAVLGVLARTQDPDVRNIYKGYVTARWISPGNHNLDGVKQLVPLALSSATTLDTVLGRLFGPVLGQLSDADLAEAIRICTTYLLVDQPGQENTNG